MSFKEFIVSAVQVLVGVVLIATGNAPAGIGLILSGLATAAAIQYAPDATEATEQSENVYGWTGFKNKVAGDTVRKVVYSRDGHKLAPTWLQMWVSPRGIAGDDYAKALKVRGQALSGLLHIAEGPILGVDNIRLNDQPLYETVLDYPVGVGNGSKTQFKIDRSRIDIRTLQIIYNGSAIVGDRKFSEKLGTGDGSTTLYSIELPEHFLAEYELKFYSTNPTRSDAALFEIGNDDSDNTGFRPHIIAVTPTRILVNTQVPYPVGEELWIEGWYRDFQTNNLTLEQDNDGAITVKFKTAPPSGTEITAEFKRFQMPRIRLELRHGGRYQMPFFGLDATRNSYGHGNELVKSSFVEFSTEDEVDDVYFNVASGPNGFTMRDEEGGREATFAQFIIEMQRTTPASGGNYWNSWKRISDPAGRKRYGQGNKSHVKNADEFDVRDDTTSLTFWSFGLRSILQRLAENSPNDKEKQQAYADFARTKYDFRLRRTSTVKNSTNDLILDEIFLSTHTEVQNDLQSWPSDALMFFEGFATENLNGRAPNITMDVLGKRDVRRWDGSSWDLGHVDNQSNRVWAALDLITNKRFGAGDHYTRDANVDRASALAAANWLEDSVLREPNDTETEQRSILDIVLDTRKTLMDHVRDICLPGGIWAVLQGDVWRFVIDGPVELVDEDGNDLVEVVYDSTPSSPNSAARSFSGAHNTVAEVATEVQVDYLSRTERFEHMQAWKPLEDPSTEARRIHRASAYGIVRDSEAARYARRIWVRSRSTKTSNIVIGLAPQYIDIAAGDVFRIVSSDMYIDGYWRAVKISFNTEDFYCRVEATQYDPAVYGQNIEAQRVLIRPAPRANDPAPAIIAPRSNDGSDRGSTGDDLPRAPDSGSPTSGRRRSGRQMPLARAVRAARARRVR